MEHKDELVAFLKNHNIQCKKWGVGEAKTLEHLLREVTSEFVTLVWERGRVLRVVEGSVLKVYYHDRENLWHLTEKEHVFRDGRRRVRKTHWGIGEKIRKGESAIDAAHRALLEGLGITERLSLILRPLSRKGPIPSTSFPGLYSLFLMHTFVVYLPNKWYRSEGYVEARAGKQGVFVWERQT